MSHSHEIHRSIYNRTLAYYFQEEARKKELVSPIMYDLIEQGNRVTTDQYHQALKSQAEAILVMDEFMKDFDAAVCLSTAGAAPSREELEVPDSALMWTLTHLPVIGIPAFVSPEGLPFGIQLIARKYNDLLLFELAKFLNSCDFIPDGPNPVLDLSYG
jgi:Asp-tRNA(Asn)/Glu-tRNA(Gln) amidotransferase A subunit family amidase